APAGVSAIPASHPPGGAPAGHARLRIGTDSGVNTPPASGTFAKSGRKLCTPPDTPVTVRPPPVPHATASPPAPPHPLPPPSAARCGPRRRQQDHRAVQRPTLPRVPHRQRALQARPRLHRRRVEREARRDEAERLHLDRAEIAGAEARVRDIQRSWHSPLIGG